MGETTEQVTTPPGAILKAAREEGKRSVEEVAESLHLRASVVEAMELGRYDEFDSDVFLKGYFRSYCRLVGLHEERMVDLLEKQLEQRQEERRYESEQTEKALQQEKRKKLLKNLTVLLGLVALVTVIGFSLLKGEDEEGLALQGADSASIPEVEMSSQGAPDAASIEQMTASNGEVAELGGAPDPIRLNEEESPGTSENASDVLSADSQRAEVTPVLEGSPQLSDSQSSQFGASGNAELDDATAGGASVSRSEALVVDPSTSDSLSTEPERLRGGLVITFSGDCWFTLKNGEDKTVIAALKRAGQSISYDGPKPYRLVLGAASTADVTYEGQIIDLAPYTRRNGRAEFVLD